MNSLTPLSLLAPRPLRFKLAPATLAVALAVAVSLLNGCANYAGIHSDKQMAAAENFQTSQSLPDEGGTWPTQDWARQFGDPQLPALIQEALAGNPSIADAQARIAKAAAYAEGSHAKLLPSVGAQYTLNRELFSANALYPPPFGGTWFTETNGLLNASFELDLWGKNREKLKQAISQEKAAEAEAQEARLTLAASVASTYNQLAQLYAQRAVIVQEIQNRNHVGNITGGRLKAGLDTAVESNTAESNVATSRTNLSHIDGEITTTRYQLGSLLGKGPDRGLQIAVPKLSTGDAVQLPDNIPADLVSRRPDLVAARWQVEAASHDIKVAKADFYPDINLAAALGFDSFGFGRFLTAGSRQVQFGPAVHLPIFDAGLLRSELKGKYADFDSAVAHYNQTLIGALNDVATQIAAIHSVDQQLVDANHAYAASQRAYNLAVTRYGAGLTSQLQVLSADMNQLAQKQTVVDLTMQRRDLQVRLIKALGGGFNAATTGLAAAGEPSGAAPQNH